MGEVLPPVENEVSVEELIMAYSDVLNEADRVFIKDCDFDEAISYVYELMVEQGVKDPDNDLVKRGILREDEI